MSTEWGIFSDEGMIEGEFYLRAAAEDARAKYNEGDPDYAHVGEVCPDHEGHERDTCEECNAEEDEDDA